MKKDNKFYLGIIIGIYIGLIHEIIKFTGIILFLVLTILLILIIVARKARTDEYREIKEELSFYELYQKAEMMLKNIIPEAETRVELKTPKEDDVCAKIVNAELSYNQIKIYGRVNDGTKKVEIIVRNDKNEKIFEDEISCELFLKYFEV